MQKRTLKKNKNRILNSRKMRGGDIVKSAMTLADFGMSQMINGATWLTGLDWTNKESVVSAFQKYAATISDPQTLEEFGRVLQAAKPAIIKLGGKMTDIVTDLFTRLGRGFVNVGLNTAEGVPGIGAGVAFLRDLDSFAQMAAAGLGAAADTAKQGIESAKEIKNAINTPAPIFSSIPEPSQIAGASVNMKKIQKEKRALIKMVGGSIKAFHDSTRLPQKTRRLRRY